MIRLDASTVLLQWAAGGLFFLWITTRHRVLGIGYGWLLRGTYLVMAAGGVAAGALAGERSVARDVLGALMGLATLVALVVSVVRRKAGVREGRAIEQKRTARVAAMTGIDREEVAYDEGLPEFPPVLDLVPPIIGVFALIAAALADGGPAPLAIVRTLVGAAFLGSVTDAMLLGHWYLVQPGLGRQPLHELNAWVGWTWPFEVAALLWPTGMVSVINGSIDDGYKGILGWFWIACAVTTIALVFVTRAALKEKAYSAVMAATGLLYLAILTAFGTDLVARAILA